MTDIMQRTPEWHALRLGKVTASCISDVTARTKTGYGSSRANYLAAKLCERLTGVPAERYVSVAMQDGIDKEPLAQLEYQMMMNVIVEPAGFVVHPRIEQAGASPDGYIGDDGLLEIKCPLSATHIETLLTEKIPAKYVQQMQFQMACTDCAWCDYVSFDPRLPPSMQLFVQRVPRDHKMIDNIEAEVVKFLAELDAKLAELRARYETDKAA